MSEKSICLGLSGGMDSGTLLGLLKSEGYTKIYCLGFNYGSKHNKYEIEAAKKLAAYYEADYQLIEMPFINQLFKSNLLQSGEDIPEGHYNDATMSKTVVPGRNIIFASILAGYAWSKGCNKIALGVHFGDHLVYADCRAEFIKSLDTCLYLGTDRRVSVYAPFLEITKKEILKIGFDLGVPYVLTRTCYKSQDKSCGKCVDENTLITMHDMSQKPIKDLVVGDCIWGIQQGEVKELVPAYITNIYDQGIRDTVTIENEFKKTLTLTEDHKCLSITSMSNNTKYKSVKNILKSKYPYIFSFDFTIRDKDFKEGWICGYLSHDAQFYYQKEQKSEIDYLNIKCLCQDEIEEKEVRQFLYENNIETFDSVHHANENIYKCFRIYKKDITQMITELIHNSRNRNDNFKAGWLTGALDADGYYDSGSLRYFKSNGKKEHLELFTEFLNDLNIHYNQQKHDRGEMKIGGKTFNTTTTNVIIIGKKNIFKFPTILSKRIKQFKKLSIQTNKSKIKEISRGRSRVMDITTTTGNFLANGMIVHNCGSCRERLEAFESHDRIDPIEYENSNKKYPGIDRVVLALIERTYSDEIKTDVEFVYYHENQWIKTLTDKPLERNAKVLDWRFQHEVVNLIKGDKS